MRHSFIHLAEPTAKALTRPQATALLILHREQPTRQTGSGLPGSTFKALRNKGLARHAEGEKVWFLTEFGEQVQAVLLERGGFAGL